MGLFKKKYTIFVTCNIFGSLWKLKKVLDIYMLYKWVLDPTKKFHKSHLNSIKSLQRKKTFLLFQLTNEWQMLEMVRKGKMINTMSTPTDFAVLKKSRVSTVQSFSDWLAQIMWHAVENSGGKFRLHFH